MPCLWPIPFGFYGNTILIVSLQIARYNLALVSAVIVSDFLIINSRYSPVYFIVLKTKIIQITENLPDICPTIGLMFYASYRNRIGFNRLNLLHNFKNL